MKVTILYGGKSGEHEVSLMSAASIIRAIDRSHRISLIGIARDGCWYLQPDSVLENCRESDGPVEMRTDAPQVVVAPGHGLRVFGAHGIANLTVDVVFPVLHGTFGEDGTIQGLLECADLAYVGADVYGSAVAMDKDIANRMWEAAGLPVVGSIVVDGTGYNLQDIASGVVRRFGWPVFVKPARCGSSVGASRATDIQSLSTALSNALRFDTKALIQPFIHAREIECSVVGNENPQAFPPGEIIPSHEYYDYDAKYIDPDGARLVAPAQLGDDLAGRIMDLAVQAYLAAGLSGMARIDFFIDKTDGSVYLNEANTIPGFTSISMFPRMCQTGGLAYPDLIDRLLSLAVERHGVRARLSYSKA